MRKKALCIGNNDYCILSKLDCAVSDATAVNEALVRIGFDSKVVSDLNREQLNNEIITFCDSLSNYDIALLYYAGHGFQCDSDNILAPIDLNTQKNPQEVRMDAFPLSELMQQLGRSSGTTKIVILDACRETLGYRGSIKEFLPLIAPQGSLIAFSTSPGQTAQENSVTKHGKYTEVLLKYIESTRTPVESVFKKVREDLYKITGGGQIPWEHTSLIGDVYLNPDTIYDTAEYGEKALADAKYQFSNTNPIYNIVQKLKSYNWYTQESGINMLKSTNFVDCFMSDLFVLGRNICQAAHGGCYAAQGIINDFITIDYIPFQAKQHILNGISYEIYYNSKNEIRDKYKANMLSSVLKVIENKEFYSCREFISNCLSSIYDRPIYIPGKLEVFDVSISLTEDKIHFVSCFNETLEVVNIAINGKQCLFTTDYYNPITVDNRSLLIYLSRALATTVDFIKLHFDQDIDESTTGFVIPDDGFVLRY